MKIKNISSRKKILIVFGTRPEAVKMCPLVLGLQNDTTLEVRVCVTGQHRHMLDQVLQLFGVEPHFDLDLMRSGQDLTDITCKVLHGMKTVFQKWKPDRVFVHGDTTTTMSATLAAYYAKIPVAHVEAGLRTGDIYSPWPEEVNRKLVSAIADIHFAPTEWSKENLIKEGIATEDIVVTGNTVIDALENIVKKIDLDPILKCSLDSIFSYLNPNKRVVLVTGHRRENFGEGFENICLALSDISKIDNVEVVYPVHLNPNVREPVLRLLRGIENVHLVEPLEYLPFVYLMRKSSIILTDSGGIQEEAPSLGKPVLVMRNSTERPEAIKAGTVKLVGTSREKIFAEAKLLLENNESYKRMCSSNNPYGDGKATMRIHEWIANE